MFSLVTMKVNEAAAMHVFLNEREFVSFTYCGQDHRSFIKTSEFEGWGKWRPSLSVNVKDNWFRFTPLIAAEIIKQNVLY